MEILFHSLCEYSVFVSLLCFAGVHLSDVFIFMCAYFGVTFSTTHFLLKYAGTEIQQFVLYLRIY